MPNNIIMANKGSAPTLKKLKSVTLNNQRTVTIDVTDLGVDAVWICLNDVQLDAADYVYCYINSGHDNSTRWAYTPNKIDQSQKFVLAITRNVTIDGTGFSQYVAALSGVWNSKQNLSVSEVDSLIFQCYSVARKFESGTIEIWGYM